MRRSTLDRLAPLTGIVAIGLIIAGGILSGSTPDANDSTAGIVGFWRLHDTKEIVAAFLGALGIAFFLWFFGALRSVLRASEGEPGRLAATAFGGFLVFSIGALALLSFQFAAADVADDSGVAPQAIQALSVLQSDFFFPLTAGLLVGMLASAAAVLRFGAFPRWTGYLALVVGILFVTPLFFIAFPLAGIWVIIVCVLMFRAAGASGRAAPASPGPGP